MSKSEAELCIEGILTDIFGGRWVAEYRFCERRWRFDYAVPGAKIAIELEGGIWMVGRHNRGKGYQADLDKYNRAVALGWSVFRFSTQDALYGNPKEILAAFT